MTAKYVPLSEPLYDYLLEQRSDANDPVLEALRAETAQLGDISRMSISPDQASLLTFFARLIGARWALEIGTFTGTSSISIARGLAPGGKLICFEKDFRWVTIARRYWMKAGVQDKVELRLGNAHELLMHYRPPGPLDIAFIDADKERYDIYYEAVLPLMRTGGLIIFDNMLRGGEVIDPNLRNTPANRAIDQLNRKLATDSRVQSVLIPVADGINLCRKR